MLSLEVGGFMDCADPHVGRGGVPSQGLFVDDRRDDRPIVTRYLKYFMWVSCQGQDVFVRPGRECEGLACLSKGALVRVGSYYGGASIGQVFDAGVFRAVRQLVEVVSGVCRYDPLGRYRFDCHVSCVSGWVRHVCHFRHTGVRVGVRTRYARVWGGSQRILFREATKDFLRSVVIFRRRGIVT